MCRVFDCWWVFPSLSPLTFPFPPRSRIPAPNVSFDSAPSFLRTSVRDLDLLILGVEKGYYQFTSHLIAELIRVVSKGSAPGNNLLMDVLYSIIALVSRMRSTPRPSLSPSIFPLSTPSSMPTLYSALQILPGPSPRDSD
jgi:hypothetical protein